MRRGRSVSKSGLLLVVGFLVTVEAAMVPGPVGAKVAVPARRTFTLSAGVRLTVIRYPDVPNQVRVLRVDQGAGPALEVLTASQRYPGYRQPSYLGSGAGSVAAVNGDFVAADGRPKHLSMVDGEVWTSGIQQGPVFAVGADGSRAFMGTPHLAITAKAGGEPFSIETWNAGDPRGSAVAGFTARGGSVEPPSGDPSPRPASPRFCAARLVPSTPAPAGPGPAPAKQRYTVEAQPEPCEKTPISIGSNADTVAITGRGDKAGGRVVKALEVGDAVSITTRFPSWPDVVDVIGGGPILVKKGKNVAPGYHPGDSYLFNYNPRTAVGLGKGCLDEDMATHCVTYVVTVDGRQSATWSKGMRLPQLAHELIAAGARWAMNLDGGGGTVMWVERQRPAYCEAHPAVGGCLVTRPSENGRERRTSVSLAVRPAP